MIHKFTLMPHFNRQRGVALIEVMVSALVFLLGIVGLIGLQARLNQAVTEDIYLTRAQQLVREYVNQMQLVTPDKRDTDFKTGSNYTAFKAKVLNVLPSAADPNVNVSNVATIADGPITLSDQCTDVKVSVKFTTPGYSDSRCVWLAERILPRRGSCSNPPAALYTTAPGAAC